MPVCKQLITAAENLRDAVNALAFSLPVTHVYNKRQPGSGLDYAWESHKLYLSRYADSTKKVVMLGMNPGGLCPFLPLQANSLASSLLPISSIHGKYR